MSEARKCDRCGRYYDQVIPRNYISPYGMTGKSDIDLCDDCVESFNKWLKMWEPLKDYVENDIKAVEEASKAVECRLENLPEFKPHKSSIITEVDETNAFEPTVNGCDDKPMIWGNLNFETYVDSVFKNKDFRYRKRLLSRCKKYLSLPSTEPTVTEFFIACENYNPVHKFGAIDHYSPITKDNILEWREVGEKTANDILYLYNSLKPYMED